MSEQTQESTPSEVQENQQTQETGATILLKQAETIVEPRRWVYFALLVLVILFIISSASALIVEGQNKKLEAKIASVEKERERLSLELDKKTMQLMEMYVAHDKEIKEAPKNAYKKVIAVPDSGMLAVVNDLISGARRRNAEREQNSGDN